MTIRRSWRINPKTRIVPNKRIEEEIDMDELTKYVTCTKCSGVGLCCSSEECSCQQMEICTACNGLGQIPEEQASK